MSNAVTPEVVAAFRLMMRQQGLRPEDLIDERGSTSLGDFARASVLPALTAGKRQAWAPYVTVVLEGLGDLCACTCARCLSAVNGLGLYEACACVRAGACDCRIQDLAAGGVGVASCLESCPVLGTRELCDVTLAELERVSRWVQMRATKRTLVRNARRARAGRPPFAYDGRSAVEHLRAFLSALFNFAMEDRTTGVARNLALKMTRYPRPEVQKRSYEADRLEQLWSALYSSGSNDVVLDELIVWFLLETGARRGVLVQIRVGDLLCSSLRVRLHEKKNKVDEQPVTEALMEALLSMALLRGDVLAANPEGLALEEITLEDVRRRRVTLRPDRPVFYYADAHKVSRDGATPAREPHPLSVRRFNSLWDRLKRELPWLDEIHGRPHDLRKSVGTSVERVLGHATARAFLRHSAGSVTGTYVAAGPEEAARAHAWLTGVETEETCAEEW